MVVGAKAMKARRFPPPWSAEVPPNYYVVRDANRQKLARTQSLIVARGWRGYHRCMSEREWRQFAIIVLLGVIAYAVVGGGAALACSMIASLQPKPC